MAPRVLSTASFPDWLAMASDRLREGGVVALPTETVYGLACSAFSAPGLSRLFDLKQREEVKPLPLQVASVHMALASGFAFPPPVARLAHAFWPGALTLVLPRPATLPSWFAPESDAVALRIPDHPVTLELLREMGMALAVTSANLSGQPPLTDAPSVARTFASAVDLLVLDGGPAAGGRASTVVDVTGPEPVLVREGPISFDKVLHVWRGEA